MDTTRRLITFASVSILVFAGSGTAFLGGGFSGFASSVAGALLNSNSGLTRDSQSLGSTGLKHQQGWRVACNSDAAKRTSPSMLASVKVSLEYDRVSGFAAMLSFFVVLSPRLQCLLPDPLPGIGKILFRFEVAPTTSHRPDCRRCRLDSQHPVYSAMVIVRVVYSGTTFCARHTFLASQAIRFRCSRY